MNTDASLQDLGQSQWTAEESYTFTLVRDLLALAEKCGLSSEEILSECHVKFDVLQDPLGRMTVSQHLQLWKCILDKKSFLELIEQVDDGLLTETLSPTVFAAMCSENLLECLQLVAAFKNESSADKIVLGSVNNEDGVGSQLQEPAFCISLHASTVYQRHLSYLSEFMALHCVLLFRWLTGQPVHVLEVALMGERQEHHAQLEKLMDCEFVFSADEHRLLFPASLLQTPLRTRNARMKTLLSAEARRVCDLYNPTNQYKKKVEGYLNIAIESGDTSITMVASHLGIGVRTLQRHLSNEGACFAELLDDTRKINALAHIKDVSLSIEDVMYRVGISDRKHFYLSFKKWTGVTPAVYRKEILEKNLTPE